MIHPFTLLWKTFDT